MFKDQYLMKVVEGFESLEGKHKLMVTIKEYQQLKDLELRAELKSLVETVCFDQKGRESAVIKIRLLIKNFKFVLRTVPLHILQVLRLPHQQPSLFVYFICIPSQIWYLTSKHFMLPLYCLFQYSNFLVQVVKLFFGYQNHFFILLVPFMMRAKVWKVFSIDCFNGWKFIILRPAIVP